MEANQEESLEFNQIKLETVQKSCADEAL